MKYKFRAKDLKTGEWVEGDLAYAKPAVWSSYKNKQPRPVIMDHCFNGGLVWATYRHFVDESTIELIEEE